MTKENITEADLQAYIDGQLDIVRRVEVEDYLAAHPHHAATVMEDMKLRDELQLFLSDGAGPAPPGTVRLSRRLSATLQRRQLLPRLRTGAVAAALLAAGWFAHGLTDQPVAAEPQAPTTPADTLAEDAAQAWHVAQLDAAPGVDAAGEVLAPASAGAGAGLLLAGGYRRVGGNLIPWEGGTAVLDLFVTPKGEELVLLTAPTKDSGGEPLEAKLADGVTTVSWWRGQRAYALSAALPAAALLALARSVDPLT